MAGILLNRSRQVPAEDTPAFGGIAERFRRAGDLDRAIALCREGLLKFPDQLSARVTLGWSLLDQGKYDAARAELERVLRRAPDNLAAIRGLAELHDRSEGAMPSMDERESWRHEEAAQENAAAAGATTSAASEPLVAADEDPFAPISVTLASASRQPSPEILHTADDAQQSAQAAATAAAVEALLGPDRVELENPAAAAMAAATPVLPAPEPTSEMLGGADDSLEDAVAGLGIEVSAFDPGVAAPSTSSATFSPFDTDEPEAASVDLQLEDGASPSPAMFEVEAGAASAPMAALDHPSASDTLLGSDVEFSDAADLVAALRSSESLDAADASSLVLEMPTGDAGLLDAELTAFEEAQPSAVMPAGVSVDAVDVLVEPPREAVALAETAGAYASPMTPEMPAMDVIALRDETDEASRRVVASADDFELAGMTPVDAVVSARAYDVSTAPPEDRSAFVPEVPTTLLDEERVADVGRFELPERDLAEPEEAADEFAPALSSVEQLEHEPVEGAFALTNPEAAAYVEDASAVIAQDALASEAVALEVSDDAKPILDLAEIEEPPAVLPVIVDAEEQPELLASVAEPAALTAQELPEQPAQEEDVVPDIEQVSAAELIPDTVTEAFAGLPDQDVPEEAAPEASLASPFAALVEAAVEAHVSAEVVQMTTHAEGRKSSVAALERFLRQVEQRRLQLQSGSVA